MRNSGAPLVSIACSTGIRVPCWSQCAFWFFDPSGILGDTPARAHARSMSSEQSNASGSTLVSDTRAPKM